MQCFKLSRWIGNRLYDCIALSKLWTVLATLETTADYGTEYKNNVNLDLPVKNT